MTTSFSARQAAPALPLILIASTMVASASCDSRVETPSGAGGAPPTTVVGPNSGTGSHGGSFPFPVAGAFKSSGACKDCHEGIYNDWKYSMHSRSLTDPVSIVPMNQLYGLELKDKGAPDPQRLCVQCHSPIAAAFAGTQVVLPFQQQGDVPADALTEGVGCVTCHAYTGLPEIGAAGLSDFLNDFDASGLTYYGPLLNPVNSPAHKSARSGTLGTAPESMCMNCHNVFFDTNGDGQIVAGEDLILQNTSFEHDVLYLAKRSENCIDCHMPLKDVGPVADGPEAPAGVPQNREIRHHGFVGSSFPLDDADNDVQLGLRQDLLQKAATITVNNAQIVNGTNVSFSVTVANVQAGHSLPTGFSFIRQMYLQIRITGEKSNAELATSGVLRSPTDDLCDGNTLNDALQNMVQGCIVQSKNQVDKQLVNFQTKLVTDVDRVDINGVPTAVKAEKGQETSIPIIEGSPVSRIRLIDGASLAPLAPFESRTFGYQFAIPQQADGVRLEVALKFRGHAPYFLRALAQREASLSKRLTQNIGKIKTITMATSTKDLF